MTTQTKAIPRWRLWLRRWLRPKPYWQRHLGDILEADRQPWFVRLMISTLWDFVTVFWSMIVVSVITSAFFLAARWVFLSPGFLEAGLADPIGRGLATVCLTTGYCHLPSLLVGVTLAVLLFASVLFVLLSAFWNVDDEEGEDEEDELMEPLRVLDERVVRLRADLVLAGVRPLTPEERAEVEDGD